MPTIVVSEKDTASVLMGKYLVERYFERTEESFGRHPVFRYGCADLIIIESEHIYADWLEERYPSDMYIFASRHSAESGIPCLTVHTTGNWGDAVYGGRSRTLSYAPAQHMLSALKYMKEGGLGGFATSYEVTHHGPTLNTPIMFVEVGSTPAQWQNERAAGIVAEAIMASLKPENVETAIGIGGGHYAPRFSQIALKEGVAFGHILPKYAFGSADDEMLRQAVEKTTPKPKYYAVHSATDEVLEKVQRIAGEFGLKRIR